MDSLLSWLLPTVTYKFDFRQPTAELPQTGPRMELPRTGPGPRQIPTESDFQTGFAKFGSGQAPIATGSAQLAQAAQQLPPTIDPYLMAVLSLMETGGGTKQVGANNPFNIRGIQDNKTKFINYPDLTTAILGGQNQGVQSKGFLGQILQNPAYAPYRQSGNLADFFQAYTPPGPEHGNPSMEELLSRYNTFRALFPQ